jgi:hypothetical protein
MDDQIDFLILLSLSRCRTPETPVEQLLRGCDACLVALVVTHDPHQRGECVRPMLNSTYFQVECQTVGNTDSAAPAPRPLVD